jgi:hypothetical protein
MVDSILPRCRTMAASWRSALDARGREAGDRLVIEPGERRPERLPLAQDRQPAQSRLEAFEADLLEQPVIVGDRPAPLAS